MRRKYIFAAAVGALFSAVFIGAVTMDYGRGVEMHKMTITWTSSAAGAAAVDISAAHAPTAGSRTPFAGLLFSVTTIPDSGATSPTDDYDIVLVDTTTAEDILQGACANRDAATTEAVYMSTPSPFVGTHQLRVSNAGNANGGTVVIKFAAP